MTLEEIFGKKLREIRKYRRLTQAELGRLAGIPQTTISNWEVGVSEPRWREVVTLSKLLSVPLDIFIDLVASSTHLPEPKANPTGIPVHPSTTQNPSHTTTHPRSAAQQSA